MKTTSRRHKRFGLLGNGSSSRWDVAVNESLDGGAWSLEIEGPQFYLVFQLRSLQVIPEAVRFLQSGSDVDGPKGRAVSQARELLLGRFGSGAVSLLADNEDIPRCFLVIGPKARSTLRLSLGAQDMRMLGGALEQVIKDLPQDMGKRRPGK